MADIPLFPGGAGFSQVEGYKIPFESSIDAYLKGAQAGEKIPSAAGAIAKGVTEAIKTKTDIEAKQATTDYTKARTQEILNPNQLEIEKTKAQTEYYMAQAEALRAKNNSDFEKIKAENEYRKELAEESKLKLSGERESLIKSDNKDARLQALDPKYAILGQPQYISDVEGAFARGDITREQANQRISPFIAEDAAKKEQTNQINAGNKVNSMKDAFQASSAATVAAAQAKLGKVYDVTTDEGIRSLIQDTEYSEPDTSGNVDVTIGGEDMGKLTREDKSQFDKMRVQLIGSGKIAKNSNPYSASQQETADTAATEKAEAEAQEKKKSEIGFFGKVFQAFTTDPNLASLPGTYAVQEAERARTAAQQVQNQQTVIAPSTDNTPVQSKKEDVLKRIQSGGAQLDAAKQKFQDKKQAAPTQAEPLSSAGSIYDTLASLIPEFVSSAHAEEVLNQPPVERAQSLTGVNKKIVAAVSDEPLLQSQPAIIKALAAVESGGRKDAVSPTGVRGLLQVTRATANQYGLNRDIPEQNVQAGVKEIGRNMRILKSPMLAAAAYNAGIGTITDAIKATQSYDWDVIKGYLRTTLPAAKYREVENYPEKVAKYMIAFADPNNADDLYTLSLMRV